VAGLALLEFGFALGGIALGKRGAGQGKGGGDRDQLGFHHRSFCVVALQVSSGRTQACALLT